MPRTGPQNLSQRVHDIILECGKLETVSRANLAELYEEIVANAEKAINTVQQIILKLITGFKQIAKQKHVFYENFFLEFFKFLSQRKDNENLETFLSYFIEFFALGIESGNHQLKWMFAKFLYLLIENYSFDTHKEISKSKPTRGRKPKSQRESNSGQRDMLQKVIDCCLALLNENKLQSKKFALNILKRLQELPGVEKQVKLLLLNVIATDKHKEIRKIALTYINVDGYTADAMSYRIRDMDHSIRTLLLKKYVKAKYDFLDLNNNSKSIILYNLVFSNKEHLPYLSELLISPLSFEAKANRQIYEDQPDDEFFKHVLRRITDFIASYDIRLVFFFERLYVLIKQTIFKLFENLKYDCMEYIIGAIMETIFGKRHMGIEYQYKPQLFLLLMVVHFLTEKAGVKTEAYEMKTEYDETVQQKDADYKKLMMVLDESSPSMLKVLEVTESIFKLVSDIESKHMILQYVLITNFDDVAKEKLIGFLLAFMRNFEVKLPVIENNIEAINSLLESKGGFGPQNKNTFVKALGREDFILSYFMRGGCVEFIPLVIDSDIFGSIIKVLYYLIPNDNQNFSVTIKQVLDHYGTLNQQAAATKFIQCQVLMYFMSNCKSFSDNSVKIFTRHISQIFNHIEENYTTDASLYGFMELCALKALGLIMLNSADRMLRMGSMLNMYIRDGDKVTHKVMSYGLLFDFFTNQNAKSLKQKCEMLEAEAEAEEDEEILSIGSVLDLMQKNLFEPHNPRTLNILLTGFVKLIYNNREFLKCYNVDLKQIMANLILFWHDKKLRDKEETHTSIVQTLSTFFIHTVVISYDESYRVINGLLLLLETIGYLKEQGYRFSRAIVDFDIYDDEFIKNVAKSFINLTNMSLSNNVVKADKFYGLNAQEVFVMYLMHKGNECGSYLGLLDDLLPFCVFWDHSELRALRIMYKNIEDLLAVPQMVKTTNLKNLKEKLRGQLNLPDGQAIELNDEENEITAEMEDKWKMIRTGSITYFKDLKDTYGALDELNSNERSKKKSKVKLGDKAAKKVRKS